MKRKHHGMISIVIIVVVLIPTAIYAVYSLRIPVKTNSVRLTGTSSEFIVPDITDIKEISKLEKKMMELVNPSEVQSVPEQPIRFWNYSDQHYSSSESLSYSSLSVV